jgi:predicted transcriptional regulator
MTKRAFGELEAQILYILKSKPRMTVKEVHQALGSKDNYNTVMTVMSRLAEKQQLGRERVGLHYEYWLTSPSSSFLFLDKVKQKFSGVKTSALVSHLIESANDLTDEDLAQMEQIVHKLRESRK